MQSAPCPSCGKTLRFETRHEGRSFCCPNPSCRASLRILPGGSVRRLHTPRRRLRVPRRAVRRAAALPAGIVPVLSVLSVAGTLWTALFLTTGSSPVSGRGTGPDGASGGIDAGPSSARSDVTHPATEPTGTVEAPGSEPARQASTLEHVERESARPPATAEREAERRAAERQAAEERAEKERAAERRAAERRAAERRAAERRAAERREAERQAVEARAEKERARAASAPPPIPLVPGRRAFDAGIVKAEVHRDQSFPSPGAPAIEFEFRHVRYRPTGTTREYEIRPLAGRPLRLGLRLREDRGMELFWVAQPYRILEEGKVVYEQLTEGGASGGEPAGEPRAASPRSGSREAEKPAETPPADAARGSRSSGERPRPAEFFLKAESGYTTDSLPKLSVGFGSRSYSPKDGYTFVVATISLPERFLVPSPKEHARMKAGHGGKKGPREACTLIDPGKFVLRARDGTRHPASFTDAIMNSGDFQDGVYRLELADGSPVDPTGIWTHRVAWVVPDRSARFPLRVQFLDHPPVAVQKKR